ASTGRALVGHPASASTVRAADRASATADCRPGLVPARRNGQRFGAASWPGRTRSVDTLSAAARVFANYDNFPREESSVMNYRNPMFAFALFCLAGIAIAQQPQGLTV